MNYTPQARAALQRMPANTASDLSKKAERVARMMDRVIVGLEVLETASLVSDDELDRREAEGWEM